tara:strand:+ start:448 stop:678 length:231 start_codon:yes stop_codon:yes gene_type:complete
MIYYNCAKGYFFLYFWFFSALNRLCASPEKGICKMYMVPRQIQTNQGLMNIAAAISAKLLKRGSAKYFGKKSFFPA